MDRTVRRSRRERHAADKHQRKAVPGAPPASRSCRRPTERTPLLKTRGGKVDWQGLFKRDCRETRAGLNPPGSIGNAA